MKLRLRFNFSSSNSALFDISCDCADLYAALPAPLVPVSENLLFASQSHADGRKCSSQIVQTQLRESCGVFSLCFEKPNNGTSTPLLLSRSVRTGQGQRVDQEFRSPRQSLTRDIRWGCSRFARTASQSLETYCSNQSMLVDG
jgi:hypothetical protein